MNDSPCIFCKLINAKFEIITILSQRRKFLRNIVSLAWKCHLYGGKLIRCEQWHAQIIKTLRILIRKFNFPLKNQDKYSLMKSGEEPHAVRGPGVFHPPILHDGNLNRLLGYFPDEIFD